MTFEDFKQVLCQHPDDFAQKMYHYGYSCGERGCICFQDIRTAFYNYNIPQDVAMAYIRKIIGGYVACLSGA